MSTPAQAERTGRQAIARNRTPIAISGVGAVTSLGSNLDETFHNLCAGRAEVSGGLEGSVGIAESEYGGLTGFPVDAGRLRRVGMWDDTVFSILEQALEEALSQARFEPTRIDPARVAVVVGLSKGAVRLQSRWAADPHAMASDPLAASLGLAGAGPSAGALYVASRIGSMGPVSAPITACATGLTCLRTAADMLEQGICDVAIAGAADASLVPMIEAAFRRMRALASPVEKDEPPGSWIRPWSARRNGFLIGEGGALFVLERVEDLNRSGRQPMAVLRRFATGSEAHHATRPNGSAEVLSRVLREALSSSRAVPSFVHLHATATRDYDPMEAAAIRMTLGPEHRKTCVVASKPLIGHCLGAAGAVELAIACKMLATGVLHPFEPRSPFDFAQAGHPVGPLPVRRGLESCLKIVAGFGGHIEACLLSAPD
jgi:3-oxoacyl-[acyl-carrier-protein] synthase II